MSFLKLFSKKEKVKENKVEEERTFNFVKENNYFIENLRTQVVENKKTKGVETMDREGDGQGFNSKISS